jgi:hypothetical protein
MGDCKIVKHKSIYGLNLFIISGIQISEFLCSVVLATLKNNYFIAKKYIYFSYIIR